MNNGPILVSCKELKSLFTPLNKIFVTSESFTIGRALTNSVVIPFLAISRIHCSLNKLDDNSWFIEDFSTFGIEINGKQLGKGKSQQLFNNDVIKLEPSEEFVYKFMDQEFNDYEIPRKRIKLEKPNEDDEILLNVKLKFEESQNVEIKHIEDKIQNAKQMQTNSMVLKNQIQQDMDRKLKQLEQNFALQIENLKGEKLEVENQKAQLLKERDAHIVNIKLNMETQISELKNQISKHNQTESDLFKENSILKEKLQKEREEFLSELNRESSSKQDILQSLENKMKQREEILLKEKSDLEKELRRETEQLRLAKENELKDLEQQKIKKENELMKELNEIKKKLQEQIEQSEKQKVKTEHELNEQMEQMKKLSDEDKATVKRLRQNQEEIENKFKEAELKANKSLDELKQQVSKRETELAALAVERIQKQADQSSGVINTLQEQLEKVKNQLVSVESEKNILLENICTSYGEGTSKQSTMAEVGELMENELQCSICSELFIEAVTLNCSHTFCKYCITKWKEKKKDCPICRAPISTECRSLVLDSLIDKMAQMTEEMKEKRKEMLESRKEEVTSMTNPKNQNTAPPGRRRRRRTTRTTTTTTGIGTRSTRNQNNIVDLTTSSITIPRQDTVSIHQLRQSNAIYRVLPGLDSIMFVAEEAVVSLPTMTSDVVLQDRGRYPASVVDNTSPRSLAPTNPAALDLSNVTPVPIDDSSINVSLTLNDHTYVSNNTVDEN